MSGDHPRVLVVDDLEVNLKLLTAILRANSFEVATASSGTAALAAVRDTPFALVMLDLRMPDIDGLAVTRTLRADPSCASLVIVAVTANAMKSDEAAALEAGCDAFVTKPINTRTLIPLVRDLLARGRPG